MIGVSLGGLMLVCVVLALVFVGLWWLVAVSNVRDDEARKHEGIITCRICGVRYEPAGADGYDPQAARPQRLSQEPEEEEETAQKEPATAVSTTTANGHAYRNGRTSGPGATVCPACGTPNEWQAPGVI